MLRELAFGIVRGAVPYPTRLVRALERADAVAANSVLPLILTVPSGRVDAARQDINFWSPESWQRYSRGAGCRSSTVELCPSPNSPGGEDNLAIIR